MKPYAFDEDRKNDTGCCPGHDWPRCYRWAGRYSSTSSKRTDKKRNDQAKRTHRRNDKMKGFEEE